MADAEKKPITKTELIAVLAERGGLSKQQVSSVLDGLVEIALKEARWGFTIPGLGKLTLEERQERMGRNPATGTAIKIAAKTVLKFRIAKAAKDAIVPAKG